MPGLLETIQSLLNLLSDIPCECLGRVRADPSATFRAHSNGPTFEAIRLLPGLLEPIQLLLNLLSDTRCK